MSVIIQTRTFFPTLRERLGGGAERNLRSSVWMRTSGDIFWVVEKMDLFGGALVWDEGIDAFFFLFVFCCDFDFVVGGRSDKPVTDSISFRTLLRALLRMGTFCCVMSNTDRMRLCNGVLLTSLMSMGDGFFDDFLPPPRGTSLLFWEPPLPIDWTTAIPCLGKVLVRWIMDTLAVVHGRRSRTRRSRPEIIFWVRTFNF